MKAVLQRVSRAKVIVEGQTISEIGRGYLILLGVLSKDTGFDIDKLVNKIPHLRIFEDDYGKMNLSLAQVQADVLVVPNFTLLANCKKGRRPSFCEAGDPHTADSLYKSFCCELSKVIGDHRIKKGIFGADMKVELVNDGPVTIILDSSEL